MYYVRYKVLMQILFMYVIILLIIIIVLFPYQSKKTHRTMQLQSTLHKYIKPSLKDDAGTTVYYKLYTTVGVSISRENGHIEKGLHHWSFQVRKYVNFTKSFIRNISPKSLVSRGSISKVCVLTVHPDPVVRRLS